VNRLFREKTPDKQLLFRIASQRAELDRLREEREQILLTVFKLLDGPIPEVAIRDYIQSVLGKYGSHA
jgi:cell division protein FtsB